VDMKVNHSTIDSEADSASGVPLSEIIRDRLRNADQRFFANDNIAEYIHEGELDGLLAEVQGKLTGVLESLVIDIENDHNTQDTARRVAKMFVREVFAGRYAPMPAITEFPNATHLNELMIVGPLTVRSACSHHLCPIMGKLWIGIMPNAESNLIGLSKFARIADWIMSRPQIQEEAISELANVLEERIRPDGLAVVMEASHFCMQWRGVKDIDAKMTNSVMRGSFLTDPALRREFLSLRSV
jgi:GTP cyclohydrolase IA